MPAPDAPVKRSRWCVVFALALGCAGCTAAPAAPPASAPPAAERTGSDAALRPVLPAGLPPLLDDGDTGALRTAVGRSRRWLAAQPPDRALRFGPRSIPASEFAAALAELDAFLVTGPSPQTLAAHLRERWDLVQSSAGPAVLVTGYYEPVIAGSRTRSAEYPVPILGPPADLLVADLGAWTPEREGERIVGPVDDGRLVPYPTRAEISAGALAGRAPVLGWARNPVDLFFVEVQGSGAVRLAEGGELRIGYAGSNGRPYRSIGRLLIDEGRVSEAEMSMQAIRSYLAAHPEEVPRVLNHNPSYVFFRELNGPPLGSLGEPVTPGRSIATDHAVFPPGALAWIQTTRPDGTPLTRLVLNQDTGGAIRGPGRVDFFWGRGPEAADAAGRMKQAGRLFFFVPKTVTR